jgi:hypothetical protein
MVISERGTMGEFNIGQSLVARTMRPVLDTLGIVHHTLSDEANMPFIVDSSIKQAYAPGACRVYPFAAPHRRQSGGQAKLKV